ncbi:MAG: DUF3341 domain-containing protein [Chthoniobacterales bacterium]|nr:DUF3341 domain-containing protein [Chthoniobacterales bacterium]
MTHTNLNNNTPLFGLGVEFETARDLYHAAEKVRDAGYKRWDTFSPFPIHGMDQAMGIGKSWLSALVFIGGLTGFSLACFMEFGASSFLYPLVVAGKPTNIMTIPAFFPIMFELTILLSALTATFGMLALNGLPRWNHPVFNWDRFKKVTEDKFFIVIEAEDKKFSIEKTMAFLNSLGGAHVTPICEDAPVSSQTVDYRL